GRDVAAARARHRAFRAPICNIAAPRKESAMRSYRVDPGAGIANLRLRDEPAPQPGPREVLVRLAAASLNYRELMIVEHGRYPLPLKRDLVPASDGAGEVIAVGAGVTRVKVGDRVAGAIFPDWLDGPFAPERSAQLGGLLDGMLREQAVLPEDAA